MVAVQAGMTVAMSIGRRSSGAGAQTTGAESGPSIRRTTRSVGARPRFAMNQALAAYRRWHPAARCALWIGVALALLVAAFDWNWFRQPVERYFSDRSQRSVRIDHFDVAWSWTLDPTFRLRGVKIDNAPWADARPFVVAAELIATCDLSSLLAKRPVIRHLRLVDADVDLERQADGLRNWRLTRPDDRGPGVVRVMALEAVRSRIRFVHRGVGLDVQTAASTAEEASAPLTTRVAFEGTFRGAAFSGVALTGPELTFLDTGRSFAIRGHALAAGGRLEVDGRATDLFQLAAVDVVAALNAPSLAVFGPFVDRKLPATPAIAVNGHLTKAADTFSLADAAATIGSTQLSGTLSFDRSKPTSRLRADLHSRAVRLEDLRWTAAYARTLMPPQGAAQHKPDVPAVAVEPAATPTVAASAHATDGEPAARIAADVHLTADRFSASRWPAASSLDITARFADGVLAITPLAFGFGGGRATGRVDLDTQRVPPEATLRADLSGMRLEAMLPALPADKRVSGAVDGAIEMAARGHSFDEWLATIAGKISARLRGGSMSSKLDAELGLSGSRFLRALFGGSERVPIRCAATDIELRAGQARTHSLRLETERTHVNGAAQVDLKSGAFDVLLTPSPDRPGLLELRKAIQVRGTPGKVSYALADPKPGAPTRSCAERSP